MSFSPTQSYTWSFGLHAAVIIGIAALYFHSPESISTPRGEAVFTLYPSASLNSGSPTANAAETPRVRSPEISKFSFSDVQRIQRTPASAPEPVVKPQSRVAKPSAQALAPGRPERSRSMDNVSISAPRLNPADFVFPEQGAADTASTPSATETPGTSDLGPLLVEELRRGFVDREAVFAGLSALIEFTVEADGTLKGGRILTSSGSAAYDAAALAAVRRARLSEVPGDRVGQTYRVKFRAQEDSR